MDQDLEEGRKLDLEEGAEVEAVASDGNGHDPYADLRRMRDAITDDKSYDVDLPGYHGRLVARFRKLGHPEWERVNERVVGLRAKRNPNAALIGQCDILVEALMGVYLRKDLNNRDPDALESLNVGYGDDGSGEANWLDAARVVLDDDRQLPPNATQRDAVRAVIGNDLAIAPFYVEYVAWARSLVDEEETDFISSF